MLSSTFGSRLKNLIRSPRVKMVLFWMFWTIRAFALAKNRPLSFIILTPPDLRGANSNLRRNLDNVKDFVQVRTETLSVTCLSEVDSSFTPRRISA